MKENYPEDKLLPDYAAIEREKQEVSSVDKWLTFRNDLIHVACLNIIGTKIASMGSQPD